MEKLNNKKEKIEFLQKTARNIRLDVLNMTYIAGEGHIGASYSCTDILSTLYFDVLNVKPKNPNWKERDRFILSKGHGCYALYSVLAHKGFFHHEQLDTVGKCGSLFGGHPDRDKIPGIEISSGSLGHGLSIGSGMAVSAKVDKKKNRIFVLLGDGECQEGSIWEAAMFASMHKLDNLIAIVDYNKLQAIARIEDVLSLEPFVDKWKSFGWDVKEVDGHNFEQLLSAFEKIPFTKGKPSVVIAHTTKGKGVSYMENEILWHARAPTDEELKQAISEIKNEKRGK